MKKIFVVLALFSIFQFGNAQTNFEIVPPKGWKSFGKTDIVKNLNSKYVLSDEKRDEIIKNNTSIEIARFMTDSKDGTYSPNLQVLMRPNGTKNISELKVAVEKSLEGFKKVIGDFTITQPLKEIKVNGKDALIFKNEGYLKTSTDQKNYFRTTLLIIPNDKTFYQITLNDTKDDSYEKEFQNVINSIKF